jgi:phospholipid/cholesterol/gamma-HCH transport system substrate-binding protein
MKDFYFKNIKLGIFTLSGIALLIFTLYMIGKNKNMFGRNFILKARFENVQGLKIGNNVRFAGIDVGTVDDIKIINDSLLEVSMRIDDKVKSIIKKSAQASIGTDGLVGNKVLNIISLRKQDSPVSENDILKTKKPIDTDEMIRTLNKTNNDIAVITQNLVSTTTKLNNSEALWKLLNDTVMTNDISASLKEIKSATNKINSFSNNINVISLKINNGQGNIGKLINDTTLFSSLNKTISDVNKSGKQILLMTNKLNNVIDGIDNDINNGNGSIHSILKDSLIVIKLNKSLDNIEQGTNKFNENMEALKHNFLFRGYFRNKNN